MESNSISIPQALDGLGKMYGQVVNLRQRKKNLELQLEGVDADLKVKESDLEAFIVTLSTAQVTETKEPEVKKDAKGNNK